MSIKDKKALIKKSNSLLSWVLTQRQICDLELLMNGGFFPLNGFMDQNEYKSVIKDMRLTDGSLWPIPITLDVNTLFAEKIDKGQEIVLRDQEGFPLAILKINDKWKPDLQREADLVYETRDSDHPGVDYLLNVSNPVYVGGKLERISYPRHYDYTIYRHNPEQIKNIFNSLGWEKVVAFQTRNPLHKAHIELTKRAMKELNAFLLIHPVVGMTKPGDVDHYTRVRCYKHVMNEYQENSAILSLLELAMRMAGPREAVWHALIRKNYGCTHMIVGRDHAGPGSDSKGKPFYGPYDAQDLLLKYQDEIGIVMVPFKFMVYVTESDSYEAIDDIDEKVDYNTISGTGLRQLLDDGKEIPEWFTYSNVAKELQASHPPLEKRGLTIFFTGLSGSGKSTLANGLLVKLLEQGKRPVTLLDGDIVRTHLSSELGFSKEHRSLNVQRIGFVASEITKNCGIAICAPIAPYALDRKLNRELISQVGGFIEVYVNTPIEKCEERDSKGLYALARKGVIKEFTGISDPYEEPIDPEIVVNSSGIPPEELVNKIFTRIQQLGYI